MNKIFGSLTTFFYFLTNIKISFFVKIKFIIIYFIDIAKIIILNPLIKKTHFLTGQNFFYSGRHINLLLDNISLHLNSYSKYYINANIVIDVGASFGTFPLIIKYLNSKAKVYCFEPSKESFELLYKNVDNLKGVYLFNKAIGNVVKEVLFNYDPSFPEGSSIRKKEKSLNNQYLVSQTTLDNFIKNQNIKKISLLKIDTEGYEYYVLKGGKKTLSITDYLIIEVETSSIKNIINILSILEKLNFNFIDIGVINNNDDNTIGSLDLIFKNIKYL